MKKTLISLCFLIVSTTTFGMKKSPASENLKKLFADEMSKETISKEEIVKILNEEKRVERLKKEFSLQLLEKCKEKALVYIAGKRLFEEFDREYKKYLSLKRLVDCNYKVKEDYGD